MEFLSFMVEYMLEICLPFDITTQKKRIVNGSMKKSRIFVVYVLLYFILKRHIFFFPNTVLSFIKNKIICNALTSISLLCMLFVRSLFYNIMQII